MVSTIDVNTRLNDDDDEIELPEMIAIADGDEFVRAEDQGEDLGDPAVVGHHENLAETLDQKTLTRIAEDAIEDYEADLESRRPHMEIIKAGMEMLGIGDNPADQGEDRPFKGSSVAHHPLLAEATIQFNSRALAETWPADGPVKAVLMGESNDELEGKRDRIERYLNYQLIHEMTEAQDEQDRMLFALPTDGTAFIKVYYDADLGRMCRRWIPPEDFIVPYSARSLEQAPRYTERMYKTGHEVDRLMASGFWRRADLEYSDPDDDENPVRDLVDKSEGAEAASETERNDTYEILEQTRYIGGELAEAPDVPEGEEGITDEDDPSEYGVELPYIVTVEPKSRQVLSIRRAWREADPDRRRRLMYTKYGMFPGRGFYDYGYPHLIGGLQKAATGAMRAILDSAALSNIQGGFFSNELKIDGDSMRLGLGEWKKVQASYDELQKGFYQIRYPEPSQTMVGMMDKIHELGSRFMSTTETMVGDGDNKGPVGTTLALIEQASKVMSSVHKRIHKSMGEEFGLLYELNGEYLPYHYPFAIGGTSRAVYREDFDGSVQVQPVSDPNIHSQTQRIAQAQTIMEMAQQMPDRHDMSVILPRVYEALQIPDYESFIIDPSFVPRRDPVSENQAMLNAQAVQAYPDQNHQAHMQVHMAFLQQMPDEAGQFLQGPMMAHLAEHMAHEYRQTIARQMGQVGQFLPPVDTSRPPRPNDPQMDPMMEWQISEAAAQAARRMQEQQGAQQGQQGEGEPEVDAETQAKIAGERAKLQAEMQRKQQEFEQEMRHQQERHEEELRQEREKAQLALQAKTAQTQADIQGKQAKDRQSVSADAFRQNLKTRTEAQKAAMQGRPTQRGGGSDGER